MRSQEKNSSEFTLLKTVHDWLNFVQKKMAEDALYLGHGTDNY